MPSRFSRFAAVNVVLLSAALTFASGAGATTQNIKIPADEIPAADLCNGDQLQLQGTLHLVQEGDFVEDAPRQHVVAHLNSQQLTGVGLLTGQAYNVDLVTNNITNSRVDGANVTTLETTMNVVSRGSADNSKIQSVFHVTQNANGETTTAFQTANIHCNG